MLKYLCNKCHATLSSDKERYVVTIQFQNPNARIIFNPDEYYLCSECGKYLYEHLEDSEILKEDINND